METFMKQNLKDPKNWISRDLFESYCGKKSDKLLSFYDKAAKKGKMNFLSVNWLAILLLPAWLGYRRQWAVLITLSIIFAILPFVEAIFSLPIPNSGITGGLIAVGLMANSILLMNAQKDFYQLKQEGIDNEEIKSRLKNKAAPSVQYAVFSLVGYFILIFGSAILADGIFGLPY
jgi:energy-coupling factor transporter transmembrane protein EcfT